MNIGTIDARGIVTIFYTVHVNSIPTGGLLHQSVDYHYQFVSGIDTITNYGKTNTMDVIVQDGMLSIIKSASKTTMHIDETVTYTIDIQNIGTELAKNLFFQNKVDTCCSVVAGTVAIDGTLYADYDPVAGFSLPELAVGKSSQIVFQAKVNSLPPSTKVANASCISFGYIYNQYGYLREKTIFSNAPSIQIRFVDVLAERCKNNNYPQVGDTVTYTLSLTNRGNVEAANSQVLEPSIPGASFVNGSVKINGTTNPALNPFTGFNLPDAIQPKQTSNVEYMVLVNSINPANLIENIAKIPFKYQITPGGTVLNAEKDSNTVDTVANYVCMNTVKSVDKTDAVIGDILYYTIEINNSGNINATNTVFLDSIQSEASFITSSVAINGIAYPAYNPTQGFTLGIICPDDRIIVTFQAKVSTLPTPNILYNQSSLVYSYQPDPNGSILTNTVFSNTVQTIIHKAQYTIVKTVDKAYAKVGDVLVYTTTINNTGTVPLTTMKFADYIGDFLSFYTGSVYIDGVNYPDLNPSTQFPIGFMNPGDTMSIIFAATIARNLPMGYIPNMSEIILTYQQTPNSPIITETVYSNIVKTYAPYAAISLAKSVDKSYAAVGETLTYTFTATNNGNATAINTLFADIIQSEASVVAGSVLVNGISKPNNNPQTGFTLGNMATGQVVTVEFKVTVNSLPIPNALKNKASTSFSYYIDPNQQPITKTTTSNTVTTTINSYSATLTKIVNKDYATIGDTLDYTVTATNTGTVPLTNVSLTDMIPNGATFVADSVVVDGVSKPTANPNTGFAIDNVLPGGYSVVMFKATVTNLPTPPQLNNAASIAFQYQLMPTVSYISGNITSNTVTTTISTMSVTNNKSVDKAYATVGDTLTYSSVITNNGNISITNVNFVDAAPNETAFVVGSVKINGVAYSTYDPHAGFSVGTILAGDHVTVTFDVTVNNVPNSGYITNVSTINYQYKIDPNAPYISANVASNIVVTNINFSDLMVTKTADRTVVRLTDVIVYSFVISGLGNAVLKNIFFIDTIQAESSFKPGTVFVNGVNRPTYDPNTGFNLNDIPIGQQTTVSFEVTANSIPVDNKLLNKVDATYSYYVDPNGSPTTKTKASNTTTVNVYDTIISTTKTVDKSIAKLGDTINFTISIKNEGNVSAQHVIFEDILDSHIAFINDSVYVNGTQKLQYNPNNGFNLDDITAGSTTTIVFAATVMSRSSDNIIYNYATVNYDYTVGTEVITTIINTNTTQTFVAIGELTVTKSVDKVYATVGDNLAYTVTVKNTGSVNAANIGFQDLIPASTLFNSGTVVIDGIPQPTFNPSTGFALTDLTHNQYHTITFIIHVSSLPQSGHINNTANATFTYKLTTADNPLTTTAHSNTVTTYIKLGYLTATKAVDKAYATIGNTLNNTVSINNTGNANCFEVFFQDIVQSNASFVTGSVKVNGVAHADYNPNTGFYLDDVPGYGSTVVTFAVTVQSVPSGYTIFNKATGGYKYYIDPANPPVIAEGTTNTVTTQINVGSLTATKAVSKAYATLEDVLTYTVNIVNAGNVVSKNVNFRDVLPAGLTFVAGSVTIKGTSYPNYNPYASFTLGNILAGDTVAIKFDATVTSLPTPSLVSNTADITFAYRIDPSGPDIPVIVNSNTVTTQINVGSITANKIVDKTYATMGDVVTYTVIVTNTGNVRAENVIFSDDLQSDITFNSGSVKVNGTTHPVYDPTTGFSLGNIETLDHVTVVFTVTVIASPTHDALLNYAVGTFSYKIDPNEQYYSKSSQSNTVLTVIIKPSLSATKIVNKLYATLQDSLNYSILVKNEGNTTISQLFFTDFLSNGAVFKAGTVVVDGVSYPVYDPIAGFNLPKELLGGVTSLVEFQATVTALPSPPQVTNYAVANGVYYVDPQGPTYPITATSNTVITNINIGSLSNTKAVDKMYAKVNDLVSYTSTITNTGNVIATSLFFTDILQSGLTFISGTVSINGVVYPTLNPTTGFQLSNLAPGQTAQVAFEAKIQALPTPAYVTNKSNINFSYKIDPNGSTITKDQTSNTVTTYVVLSKLNAVKAVDKPIATINDVLTYTITLTNVGNVIANDALFQDNPSTGVAFKAGSVKVNGVSQPTYNPVTGFSLGDIGIGNVVIVLFEVNVVAVPPTNQVTNQAVVTFKFVVDPKQQPYTDTTYSNTVTTNISLGSLSVTKAANKQYATIGEEITYTITIVNTGNINATNVVFNDPTPHNAIFVMGSVAINGVLYLDYNPSAGFSLNTMVPGQIITVVYKVQVVNLC